jgi:outer membrane biogenesis lipoprotein LolB
VRQREKPLELQPAVLALALLLAGCARSPPMSQFPNARSLLKRLEQTQRCSRGLSGEGKIDYFGRQGRLRGTLLFLAASPDRVRLDVVSPFGATLSTLTSNGRDFALYDLRQKTLLRGPANACNLGQFTGVPMPPHALVSLLRGEPPVLVHDPPQADLSWEDGRYVIRIRSRHQATQEIAVSPRSGDFDKPYAEQQLELESVEVRQQGYVLYRAELEAHRRAATAGARVDPDGLGQDLPPSGPQCGASLPRRLHLEVPAEEQDVVLTVSEIAHNPPLTPGVFEQSVRRGVVVRSSPCSR